MSKRHTLVSPALVEVSRPGRVDLPMGSDATHELNVGNS